MIRVNLLASGTEPAHKPWHKLFVIPQEQRAALIGLTMLVATAIGVGTWWWSIDRERKRVDAEISVAEAALTDFIDRLQVSGRFAHTIDIVTTSMETVASQSVVRFAIRGEVTALAGPEGDQ